MKNQYIVTPRVTKINFTVGYLQNTNLFWTYLSHHEGECVGAGVEADEHTDSRQEPTADLYHQQ